MQTNININPDNHIEIKEFKDFVLLSMKDRNRSTEITLALNVSHIKQLHEALNKLYEMRFEQGLENKV